MLKISSKLNNKAPFILEILSAINKTSYLIPIISYPFIECYTNWKNVVISEYPIRSTIRATITTSSFAIGPILTEIAGFSWLNERSLALYQMTPIFNQLPETAGTIICSAYICSYFFTWTATYATNFFNYYKFDGTDNYLTPGKTAKISEIMKNNKFNISQNEIVDIFNKINTQSRLDPNNKTLNNLIKCLRKGDLQTILDNAHLLETEISIINNKINTMSNQTTNEELVVATMPPNTPISPSNHDNPNNREQLDNVPLYDSETEHPDRGHPPIPAIIHQYQKKSKYTRNIDDNETINRLKTHRDLLKTKRYIHPSKTFTSAP